MAVLTVDGQDLPGPTGLDVRYESVGCADRAADGTGVADRVAVKRKIAIRWERLDGDEARQVLNAMTAAVFLQVALPDPMAGGTQTFSMRAENVFTTVAEVTNGQVTACAPLTVTLTEQ